MAKTFRGVFDGQAVRPLEPIDLPPASEVTIVFNDVVQIRPSADSARAKFDLASGMLHRPDAKHYTLEEMDEAVGKGLAEDFH